jgi:hypothetical protein
VCVGGVRRWHLCSHQVCTFAYGTDAPFFRLKPKSMIKMRGDSGAWGGVLGRPFRGALATQVVMASTKPLSNLI